MPPSWSCKAPPNRPPFGIPHGSDGSQGPAGEVSQAQFDSAISGTSANTNNVST
jgi:hypothetical protein